MQSDKSCEVKGKGPAMIFRPLTFNPLKEFDVCQDEDNGNQIRVKVSGRSLKLEGFANYPEVYIAFYNGLVPEPVSLTPKVSNGFGFASKIKDYHATDKNWPEQTILYPALPNNTTPFYVDVVIWHRYYNSFTGATHVMMESLEIRIEAGQVPSCPAP